MNLRPHINNLVLTVGHTQVLTMALSYVRAAKVLGGYSDIAKWLVEHDECADYLDVTVPGSASIQ